MVRVDESLHWEKRNCTKTCTIRYSVLYSLCTADFRRSTWQLQRHLQSCAPSWKNTFMPVRVGATLIWQVQKQTPTSRQPRVRVTYRHFYHSNVIEATNERDSSGAPTEENSYHIRPTQYSTGKLQGTRLYTELRSHD